MSRVLIVNAYDIGNWGDAAIVEGMIASIRAAGHTHVTVAAVDWAAGVEPWRAIGADAVVRPLVSLDDAPSWLRRPRPVRVIPTLARYGRARVGAARDAAMNAYRDTDLVLSTGGGYLGGGKSGGNLVKAMNIRGGIDAHRPTVVAPVTVNPSTPRVRRILHWGLTGSRVFVRDVESQGVLEAAGVTSTLVPDIALRAPSLAAASDAIAPHRSSGVLGWAPRGYRADHAMWGRPEVAESTVFDAVRELLRTSDRTLRLIAHVRAGGGDDDRAAVDRVWARFSPEEQRRIAIDDRPETLRAAVERYAELDVLITSRMHAAIFAMAVGTPAIAVGYEPKVAGVMTDLGLGERVIPADDQVTADDVVRLVQQLDVPAERARTLAAFRQSQARFGPFDAAIAGPSGGRARVDPVAASVDRARP